MTTLKTIQTLLEEASRELQDELKNGNDLQQKACLACALTDVDNAIVAVMEAEG